MVIAFFADPAVIAANAENLDIRKFLRERQYTTAFNFNGREKLIYQIRIKIKRLARVDAFTLYLIAKMDNFQTVQPKAVAVLLFKQQYALN